MTNMKDEVAVVTGGSRGIGLPVARAEPEAQLLN
jgi:NAD(P)-dependent dehydrogenase (short-subunit alcohol dehydrogenase family)